MRRQTTTPPREQHEPLAGSIWAERPRRLHRRVSARPAQRTAERWWAYLRAVLLPDERAVRLMDALAQVGTPVLTGRRVSVLGAHGGAGTSTAAVCMGLIAAAHRSDPVAVVDASSAAGGLLARLPGPSTMSVEMAARVVREQNGSGRPLVRPGRLPSVLSPADPRSILPVLDAVQRYAGATFVDGQRPGLTTGDDAVVVMCENTLRGVSTARSCMRDLAGAGVHAERVICAVSARVRDSGVSRTRVCRELSDHGASHVVLVPYDRHLAGAADIRLELVSGLTYLSLAELTGAALALAARPSGVHGEG